MTPQETLTYRFKTWADGKGYITRAWLFGSRAKGTARDDSDWDLALELHVQDDQQGKFFRSKLEEWNTELQKFVGLPITVDLYYPPETPNVSAAVDEYGIQIYPEL